ncbi:MAG: hypothetical protein K2K82_06210 [Muribaculaceae bacterium]|nr:hypothetical protein [Muribaculaceae bacterium]
MKPAKVYILLILILAWLLPAVTDAQEVTEVDSIVAVIEPLVEPERPAIDPDLVIVSGDTIPLKLRTRNLGRHDRGLFNYLFIPKGQWMFGLTASYGELNTEDIELLSVLTNVDLNGKMYSIKPSVSWFFNHNQSAGMKINYTRAEGSLGSLGLDMGDDLSFTLRDVRYTSESYSAGVTYRAYVGLDRNKRFAVFNEADLNFTTGHSNFSRLYNAEPKLTRTRINEVSLNFSPGVCVFIMENVSFNLSFGVFGVKYRAEHQETNGVDEGTRISSGANFRFNIFNINFGLGVHI